MAEAATFGLILGALTLVAVYVSRRPEVALYLMLISVVVLVNIGPLSDTIRSESAELAESLEDGNHGETLGPFMIFIANHTILLLSAVTLVFLCLAIFKVR